MGARAGTVHARLGAVALLALLVGGPLPLRGQAHDVPSFHPPYGEDRFGLALVFPDEVTEVGMVGTWRRSGGDLNLGLRAGAMGLDGEVGLLGGLDVKQQVIAAGTEFPVDVAWVSGVGVSGVPARDVALVRVPLGLSLGRRLSDGEVSFTPYLHPRLALDFLFRSETSVRRGPLARGGRGDETELRFDLDLGFDASFGPAWSLRVGLTLGFHEAVGVGLAFGPR